jgi:hypothetical protein
MKSHAPAQAHRISSVALKSTACLGVFLILMLLGAPAMATEEPAFLVSMKDGAFEVRSYPTLIATEVTVTGTRDEASTAGFKLLAGYIFGGNTRKQSIAMTAPVVQAASSSEKIAMTAPLLQSNVSGQTGAWTVRFIMPKEYTLDTLPTPNNSQVKLMALPPARYATVTFSGLAREGDVADRTAELKVWMASHALQANGPPELARYNPPWTPWFMRRNEVLIALAP